jgi:SpoVK/Ycf46/Vps4 family AAA+-type ATPase
MGYCQNLVVIKNQPIDSDLALTRFDKVIYLDLPAKRKRFELFKFYSVCRRPIGIILLNKRLV